MVYAIARSRKPVEAPALARSASDRRPAGVYGGVGTTTLAAHWAAQLRRQTGQKVLLVDLDASSTGASFLMRVNSRYSLLDATENLHRLDLDMWKGVVSNCGKESICCRAREPRRFARLHRRRRIRHVLQFAQAPLLLVVVDLGRLNAVSLAVLEETDLFLVTTPELPALFEASRILRRLLEPASRADRLHLLFNRRAEIMISVEDIVEGLGYPIYGTIMDTPEELAESYAERRFLDEKLQVHKRIGLILRKWRGVEDKAPVSAGRGFLKRLVTA